MEVVKQRLHRGRLALRMTLDEHFQTGYPVAASSGTGIALPNWWD
jgi:hypothetical protein